MVPVVSGTYISLKRDYMRPLTYLCEGCIPLMILHWHCMDSWLVFSVFGVGRFIHWVTWLLSVTT